MSLSRFLLLLLKIAAALVTLVVVVYVSVNAIGVIKGAAHRGRLADEITTSLAEAVPPARERAARLAATGEPDGAWLEQDCAFETDEAGWMVQNYRQVCTLRSVTVWKVADEAEARALVARTEGLDPARVSGAGGCLPVAGGPIGTANYVAAHAAGDRPWCLASLGRGGYADTRPVDGRDVELDPNRGWLVLEHEQPLVDEDLGCVHWSVLFCDNPFGDEVAWGEAPD